MADFRKWLFALAVVALLAGFTVPASAQIPSTPICSSQVATYYLAARKVTRSRSATSS